MENTVICPTCKSNFEKEPKICSNCGYPFSGTDKEKSLFIGQQIVKKSTVHNTKDRIKRARNILWILGGLNIIYPFIGYVNNPFQFIYIIIGLFFGLFFIGFGFLTYKKPFISIVIPLIIWVLFQLLAAFGDPSTIFQGIIWKGVFLTALIYALISIVEAEKIKKESEFLKQQKY